MDDQPGSDWLIGGVAAFQVADGVACAAKMPYLVEALDRVSCPPQLRPVLPVVKIGSAAGLVAGLKAARLGLVTSVGLVGYFLIAIGFHIRSKDSATNTAPAVGMLALVLALTVQFARRVRDAA